MIDICYSLQLWRSRSLFIFIFFFVSFWCGIPFHSFDVHAFTCVCVCVCVAKTWIIEIRLKDLIQIYECTNTYKLHLVCTRTHTHTNRLTHSHKCTKSPTITNDKNKRDIHNTVLSGLYFYAYVRYICMCVCECVLPLISVYLRLLNRRRIKKKTIDSNFYCTKIKQCEWKI